MIYRFVVRVRFIVQVAVLQLSFALHRLFASRAPRVAWVVGPYEIAGIVRNLAAAVPSAESVILARHPFYDFAYDWSPSARTYPGSAQVRVWLQNPWKLGQLATRASGFIYVSGEGYLHAEYDQRAYEFAFLNRHGIRIACYFTGNDIRSPRLMKQLERDTGRPNIGTYLGEVNRVFDSPGYDDVKRRLAEAANRYADVVFNAEMDQQSYLEGDVHPFFYFQADAEVTDDLSKFDRLERPVVLHAPSSPILKGTQVVRAAIAELRAEGYDFEYLEIVRAAHSEVLEALSRAHIVLNEFYSYVPGVFGIEAMASGCALLTSADERLDPQLPEGSNSAWLVTEHHQIASNLRALLDDPELARRTAVEGRDWVRRHAVASVTGKAVADILGTAGEAR